MTLPLKPWIKGISAIFSVLLMVLYVQFNLPGFTGLNRDLIQDAFFNYAVPSIGLLIIFGGTGLFAFTELKYYRYISWLFLMPLVIGAVVYVLDRQLLPFLWFFFLALLAQTLNLFVILSTRKKPSHNLIITLIFFFVCFFVTQILVEFDLYQRQVRFEEASLSQ